MQKADSCDSSDEINSRSSSNEEENSDVFQITPPDWRDEQDLVDCEEEQETMDWDEQEGFEDNSSDEEDTDGKKFCYALCLLMVI